MNWKNKKTNTHRHCEFPSHGFRSEAIQKTYKDWIASLWLAMTENICEKIIRIFAKKF